MAVAPRESIRVVRAAGRAPSCVSSKRDLEEPGPPLQDPARDRQRAHWLSSEMIEVDQDLESDLGIDSIKRVEIFSVVQDRLPSSVFEKLAQSNQDLTRVRNLKGWVEALLAAGEAVDAEEASIRRTSLDAYRAHQRTMRAFWILSAEFSPRF